MKRGEEVEEERRTISIAFYQERKKMSNNNA